MYDIETDKSAQKESNSSDENTYDHLKMKHVPGNKQDELKSLQERLNQYMKYSTIAPWEDASRKLLTPDDSSASDLC